MLIRARKYLRITTVPIGQETQQLGQVRGDSETTDRNSLSYLFEPFPADELTAYQVNLVVNNAKTDLRECAAPVQIESERG